MTVPHTYISVNGIPGDRIALTNDADGIHATFTDKTTGETWPAEPPYPWCMGHPTVADCVAAGYCRRNPNCGE